MHGLTASVSMGHREQQRTLPTMTWRKRVVAQHAQTSSRLCVVCTHTPTLRAQNSTIHTIEKGPNAQSDALNSPKLERLRAAVAVLWDKLSRVNVKAICWLWGVHRYEKKIGPLRR